MPHTHTLTHTYINGGTVTDICILVHILTQQTVAFAAAPTAREKL